MTWLHELTSTYKKKSVFLFFGIATRGTHTTKAATAAAAAAAAAAATAAAEVAQGVVPAATTPKT